jgi:hypothetical protein
MNKETNIEEGTIQEDDTVKGNEMEEDAELMENKNLMKPFIIIMRFPGNGQKTHQQTLAFSFSMKCLSG